MNRTFSATLVCGNSLQVPEVCNCEICLLKRSLRIEELAKRVKKLEEKMNLLENKTQP